MKHITNIINKLWSWVTFSVFTFPLSVLVSCEQIEDFSQETATALQFVVSDFPAFQNSSPESGEVPQAEGSALTRVIGTQDIGKTAWDIDDQIIVTLTSKKFGAQSAVLTYNGTSWSTAVSFLYLDNETPAVSAIYAPCYEVTTAGKLQLKEGMQLGMTEYIPADCSIANGSISINFTGVKRTYSRLRIAADAGQKLAVTTTGFTPAGANNSSPESGEVPQAEGSVTYTLTTDDNGNAFLYGTFAVGATVSVTQGDVTFASYTFTADKNPGGTEHNKSYALDARPVIDLSYYSEGETVEISGYGRIIGNGKEYNLTLNVAADATVIFEVGTGGVKLNGLITVADGKTLTLLVEGNAEHTVKGGISLGNGSNVIIEGDLTKENNKLTVTATGGNAGIGANNGVTAGNVTIRNARVDATGSSKEVSADSNMIIRADTSISGAAIGTSDGSMGDILIENSIIVAEGGYYENTSHAPAIGIGYVGSTMGNITLKDSQITAANNGDGLASVIGAGANMHVYVSGTMGDIVITNTELNLSMAVSTKNWYAAVIGSGIGFSHGYVNMGKIIFTDVTQAELDEMIPTWLPSDFNESQGYALGRGNDGSIFKYDAFGGVWVSDGNGGTVQIGDESGYYNPE